MKKLLVLVVLFMVTFTVYGQSRPTLAILPFTGGNVSDGETLAELFSFDRTLTNAFTPVPRTSINNAIQQEQKFQMSSGMTDPETIARLGQQLGARYILSGSITRLGGQQLLIITIMQIENLQMIAGDFRTYNNISEIRSQLPDMVKNIVTATQTNTSRLQKLAILPFQTPSGDREADALAQILAIEIIRTGTYAVFPRTRTLEQVQAEYRTQSSNNTADWYSISIGQGDNPLLVLSGAVRRLGQDRMFNVAMINVETGVQNKGESVEYQVIEEGLEAMQELAGRLTENVGTEFRVSTVQEILNAVDTINRANTNNYTITLTGDITIGLNDRDIRFTSNSKKTITIRGDNRVRSLNSLRTTSGQEHPLFDVASNITLILRGNLRLTTSAYRVIIVHANGTLQMEDGVFIIDTFNGIVIKEGGIFNMNGGTISGHRGSGVECSGIFTMTGGAISGNGNNVNGSNGGGVAVFYGSFTMTGGTISNNTAIGRQKNSQGGFIDGYGGGVYISFYSNVVFIKTGGTITDNRADVLGTNVVGSAHGKDIRNYRNTTAGPNVNLDSRRAGNAGGWE